MHKAREGSNPNTIHSFSFRNFLDDKFPVRFGRNGFFRAGYNKVMSRKKHCYVLKMYETIYVKYNKHKKITAAHQPANHCLEDMEVALKLWTAI